MIKQQQQKNKSGTQSKRERDKVRDRGNVCVMESGRECEKMSKERE